MKSLLRLSLPIAILALTASLPAHADNLIVNGGFETGGGENLPNWNGYGAFGADNSFDTGAHSGNYFAAFGSVGGDEGIDQSFNDQAGTLYALSFWLASDGYTPNDFNVYIDGLNVFSETDIPVGPYYQYSINFIGTGNDDVSFQGRNDPQYLGLDDVSVSIPGVAPEPSSLVLLGTGVLSLAGAARRKLRKA
jgi:hypothetical protein